MEYWDLLQSNVLVQFIANALKRKTDELQISTALAKMGYTHDNRKFIMDYMQLIPKFREKFSTDAFLFCDKFALEQSTAKDIGKYKATIWQRIPLNSTVDDLCCGMGGDSFFLPQSLKITGIDIDPKRLTMYSHNMQVLGKTAKIICADVRNIEHKSDYFTIDPARRAHEEENQRNTHNITPTIEEVANIAKQYKGGMAKLSPGFPQEQIPNSSEIIFLGSRSDCRECLVLFGSLAKYPDTVSAIMVNEYGNEIAKWSRKRDNSTEEFDEEIAQKLNANMQLEGAYRTYRTPTAKSDLPVGILAKYIAEPAPLLIRSKTFANVAKAIDKNAHLISEGIAYVTSDIPLFSSGFSCYEIIDNTQMSTSAIRSMLKKYDIGTITLKLRGVKLDPAAEIKRLKPKGKNSATLFYTRATGEKLAILAKRLESTVKF